MCLSYLHVKLKAFMFGTVMNHCWSGALKRNHVTVANILKITDFENKNHILHSFELICTVCFEIHVTMNSFCLLYCCVRFMPKMPNELRSPWSYFFFLQLISVLRKMIEGNELEEGTEEEIVFEETEGESNQGLEVTVDGNKWKFPYWKDMQDAPPLPKKLAERGEIPFEYNHYPSDYINVQSNPGLTRKVPIDSRILNSSQHLAHTSRHSLQSCQECKNLQYTTSSMKQYNLGGTYIDISIPNHKYFEEVRMCLESPMSIARHENLSSREKLYTWIFTPVVRGRCRKGNLNLRHTMVDTFKQLASTVPCIHVLVVEEDEFEEYRQQWRSTHAIVKMPDHESGAGRSRKFIQRIASLFSLDKIFVLDDNIPYVYTVSTKY